MAHVTILGAGAYGTAFATLLVANGHTVTLWCYEPEVAEGINRSNHNKRYLGGCDLPPSIQATPDIAQALNKAQWVFEAVPLKHLRAVLCSARPHLKDTQKIAFLSKGIEQESLFLPTQVAQDLGFDPRYMAVVSGPNFAKDLAYRALSATVIACEDTQLGAQLSSMIASTYLLPSMSSDIIGVQLAGALKNVITIGIGIARGSGCAENTVAALLTWGLDEIGQVIVSCGGQVETMYGLAGCGDLFLTALGSQSRNGRLGMLLGQGKSINEALQIIGVEPEGINTVISLQRMLYKRNLSLPLCSGIADILQGEKSSQELFDQLWNT